METASAKASLRREIAARVAGLASAERRQLDERICAHLLALPLYREARQLLAYAAMSDEVALAPLLEHAHSGGKSVFLPVADAVAGTLAFRRWLPEQRLRRSSLGVSEPDGTGRPKELPSVILIPGRAFDRRGWRLGRGRGFYDRALPELARLGPCVGVAYDAQIVAAVPFGPFDRGVDAIVTECGFSWTDKS